MGTKVALCSNCARPIAGHELRPCAEDALICSCGEVLGRKEPRTRLRSDGWRVFDISGFATGWAPIEPVTRRQGGYRDRPVAVTKPDFVTKGATYQRPARY